MKYQVMIWTARGWELFHGPREDEEDARWLARLAASSAPGTHVEVLSALTLDELQQLCAQRQREQATSLVAHEVPPTDVPPTQE